MTQINVDFNKPETAWLNLDQPLTTSKVRFRTLLIHVSLILKNTSFCFLGPQLGLASIKLRETGETRPHGILI